MQCYPRRIHQSAFSERNATGHPIDTLYRVQVILCIGAWRDEAVMPMPCFGPAVVKANCVAAVEAVPAYTATLMGLSRHPVTHRKADCVLAQSGNLA